MEQTITEYVVESLMKLDKEAREYQLDSQECYRRAIVIKVILDKVANDFGDSYMIGVIELSSRLLGHTLGPLHSSIVKKLDDAGIKGNIIQTATINRINTE